MSSQLTLCAFGPLTLRVGNAEVTVPRASRELLGALVAAGPDGASGDVLLHDLSTAIDLSPGSFRTRMSRLRGLIEVPLVAVTNGRYHLELAISSVDVWSFLQECATATNHDEAVKTLSRWKASPLADVPPTEAIRAFRIRLQSARVARLVGIAAEHAGSRALGDLLIAAQLDEPFDEGLAIATANALAANQRAAEAVGVLQSLGAAMVTEFGVPPSSRIRRMELDLLAEMSTPVVAKPRSDPARTPVDTAGPLVGQDQTISALNDALTATPGGGGFVVLRGPAGSGKSTALARFALIASKSGAEVYWGECVAGEPNPFEPLLNAVPGLAVHLPLLTDAAEPTVGRLRFFRAAALLLESLGGKSPIVVIVEDVHWADSLTLSLLRFLHTTGPGDNVLIATTTRPAQPDSVDSLSAMGVGAQSALDAVPLTLDEVSQLVDARHPDSPMIARRPFSRWVHERSGGLALAVANLVSNAPDGLAVPVRDRIESIEEHHRTTYTERVSASTRRTLAIAAVVGFEFSLRELMTVSNLRESDVLDQLEEAIELRFVIERPEPDHFRFDHQLTALAFEGTLSAARRRRIFSRLASITHARSPALVRYVVGAGTDLDSDSATVKLLELGEFLMESSSFAESRRALETCLGLQGTEPTILRTRTLVPLASCAFHLDSADRISLRREAFDSAESLGNVDLMARAALAGLPNAVRSLADPERVELLQKVPIEQLEDERSHTVVVRWIQANRVSGRYGDARAVGLRYPQDSFAFDMEMLLIDGSLNLAQTRHSDIERLARRHFGRVLPPSAQRWILWGSLLAQVPGAGQDEFDRVHALVTDDGELLDMWALSSLEAALASVGIRKPAVTRAQALLNGLDLGIPDAEEAHLVQFGMDLWIAGNLDTALDLLDAAKDSIAWNTGWESFVALCAATLGDSDRATASVRSVIAQLRDEDQREWVFVAGAFLAEASFRLRDRSGAAAAADVLSAVSGQAILLGPGTAYLGPADRYLGLAQAVAAADGRAERLLEGAEAQAHQSGATVFKRWAMRDLAAVRQRNNPELTAEPR